MQLKEQDISLSCHIQENKMQIILLETLNKIGKAGEIVSVKDGFANNYLIPQKKAIIANKKNKDNLKSKMSLISANNEKKTKEANDIKAKLDGKEISIQMEANEDGNLYGNIGSKQIISVIKSNYSIDLDQESIILGNIKAIGNYSLTLRLYDQISATLNLKIIKNS